MYLNCFYPCYPCRIQLIYSFSYIIVESLWKIEFYHFLRKMSVVIFNLLDKWQGLKLLQNKLLNARIFWDNKKNYRHIKHVCDKLRFVPTRIYKIIALFSHSVPYEFLFWFDNTHKCDSYSYIDNIFCQSSSRYVFFKEIHLWKLYNRIFVIRFLCYCSKCCVHSENTARGSYLQK